MQRIIFSFVFFVFNIYSGGSESNNDDFIEKSKPWNNDGGRLFDDEEMGTTGFSDTDQLFKESDEKAEKLREEIKKLMESLEEDE